MIKVNAKFFNEENLPTLTIKTENAYREINAGSVANKTLSGAATVGINYLLIKAIVKVLL